MGKVKFLRGVESHYNATTHQDGIYFTTDDNNVNSIIMNGIKYGVPYVETTYSALKDLRDGGYLTPGAWYRITDYVTTTTQTDTQSANHPFDVIVLATSTNTLSEEARAIQHSGDTYFANSNLPAWKVCYCLDNDKSRFAWADDNVIGDIENVVVYHPESTNFGVTTPAHDVVYTLTNETQIVDGVTYYKLLKLEGNGGNELFVDTKNINTETTLYALNTVFGTTTAQASPDGISIKSINYNTPPTEEGRGVIYRLIDEFNNDIKYDFKNIQFKRRITNGQYDANGTETWCYTLNVWHEDMCQDASIVGNTLLNDEGFISGVYDNIFGYATAYDLYIDGVNTFAFALGNNVVLSIDEGEYYGIYSNTIGNVFYSNTIGNRFNSNTIGNVFNSNTVGDSFYANTIGNDFNYNTIGNFFYSNTIGNDFNYNTIGNDFYPNTIGNYFQSNTIGNRFNNNTIGNVFNSNTVGDSFNYNTVGNYFQSNTIGTRNGNTVTTIDYVRYIRVEDGVQYVNITTSATTSASAYLQNITISQGIAGASNSNRKTITHPTVNDTFQTIYRPANSQVITV